MCQDEMLEFAKTIKDTSEMHKFLDDKWLLIWFLKSFSVCRLENSYILLYADDMKIHVLPITN